MVIITNLGAQWNFPFLNISRMITLIGHQIKDVWNFLTNPIDFYLITQVTKPWKHFTMNASDITITRRNT